MKEKKERYVYLDYLRVFATFAVIVLHVSARNWYKINVNSIDWQIINFYDSIVRWGVSIFVMISGVLFLNKEIPTKKIYSKYIFRLVCAFFAWALIYSIFKEETIINKLSVFQGHYHMWFIPMIIGIYMCLPIIKPITQNDNRIKYYLFLSFIFAYVIPEIITILSNYGNGIIDEVINVISYYNSSINMNIVLGYVGCFILGYYLNKINLNKKQRFIIYILGIFGFIFTIVMTSITSIKMNHFYENYHRDFTINVLLEAILIFNIFKYRSFKNNKLNNLIQILSKYSFGAFLVHALILEQLDLRLGINTLSFNPLLSVIIISILVFLLSFLISELLNHIPIVKKYFV